MSFREPKSLHRQSHSSNKTISQSFCCQREVSCTQKSMHREAFAHRSLRHRCVYTGKPAHTQKASAHEKRLHTACFYTEKFLHTASSYTQQAGRHRKLVQRELCTQKTLTHRRRLHTASFYTENFSHNKLLHTETFTPSTLLQREAFTHSKLLQGKAFTHSSSYTEKLRDRCVNTRKLLHREAFTHRSSYKQNLLRTSLRKTFPSTTLYYKACTRLAQSTSQYYFVLQSLHEALPSTTLYYKACTKRYYKARTKHVPVLLCT